MRHSIQRIAERLTADEGRRAEMLLAGIEKQNLEGSWAVRLFTIGGQRNDAWSDISNGDAVWAIVRGGTVATVMLRRSTQPSTPEAMRVDRVAILG